MPLRIQVHAFAHVAGEPVGLPGRLDGGAPCALRASRALAEGGGGREVKAGRQAAADRGDTPVAVDAARRADGQPEAAADHRRPSSPRPTTRPGRAFLGALRLRRRVTAWRTP